MFVDACAIVSILSEEPDADAYSAALLTAVAPVTSVLAAWEAVIILSRPEKFGIPFDRSEDIVTEWLSERRITLDGLHASPRDVLKLALHAAQTYGLGRNSLSNFDCFHYAHARLAGVPMLTRDRLLQQTDLATEPN